METTIENNILVIKIPLTPPITSKSGKTMVVASSHGNVKTTALANGQPIYVGLNAYIYPQPK